MINLSRLLGARRVLQVVVTVLCGGGVACVSTDPWAAYEDLDPRGNIFVQGYRAQPPRYGHGGTESPSARKAREEQERRAANRRARDRREARRRAEAKARRDAQRKRELSPPDSLADDKPELPEEIDTLEIPPEEPEVLVEAPRDTTSVEEPKPTPKPAPKEQTLSYGRPVPGKPGMVYSPYSPDAGYVDVRGIAPGTKVKCPYTKKLFRVP